MTSRIVSEREFARLIRESAGRPVAADFGRGGVRLKPGPESDWALQLLAAWRGETVDQGDGI